MTSPETSPQDVLPLENDNAPSIWDVLDAMPKENVGLVTECCGSRPKPFPEGEESDNGDNGR